VSLCILRVRIAGQWKEIHKEPCSFSTFYVLSLGNASAVYHNSKVVGTTGRRPAVLFANTGSFCVALFLMHVWITAFISCLGIMKVREFSVKNPRVYIMQHHIYKRIMRRLRDQTVMNSRDNVKRVTSDTVN
jgi:hypothetical protein